MKKIGFLSFGHWSPTAQSATRSASDVLLQSIELAEAAEVPPSAFVRFCQLFGFSGFSEMQRLFRDAYAPRWPDYPTRIEALRDSDTGPSDQASSSTSSVN